MRYENTHTEDELPAAYMKLGPQVSAVKFVKIVIKLKTTADCAALILLLLPPPPLFKIYRNFTLLCAVAMETASTTGRCDVCDSN